MQKQSHVQTLAAKIKSLAEKHGIKKFTCKIANEEQTLKCFFGAKICVVLPLVQEGGIVSVCDVDRVCGSFNYEDENISLYDFYYLLFSCSPNKFYSGMSKYPIIQTIKNGIKYGTEINAEHSAQKGINAVINRLPLSDTPYRNWAMSNRVVFLDPDFDTLLPQKKMGYIRGLNEDYFPWTSMGLSDLGMCENMLLKKDLRRITPFGVKHHNPARNLYQTLGMKGDEQPKVITEEEKSLADKKDITRTGWNLTTAFLDLPGNYEDQIIVNKNLRHLSIKEYKKYVAWGSPCVSEGDDLRLKYPLSIEPDGEILRYNLESERAYVESVQAKTIRLNSKDEVVHIITVCMVRNLKNGFKLTNRHGNKGVIWMTRTGTVSTPDGEKPIDVIVSAKSVERRKNFGQLFEALLNNLIDDEKCIIPNDYEVDINKMIDALNDKGLDKDGTSRISTPWGEFEAITGKVFWGVIKTPEDQVWTRAETHTTNNKGLRTHGQKVSHIERSALTTWFGPDNPVIKEIDQYQQGSVFAKELIKVIYSLKTPRNSVTVKATNLTTVDQSKRFLHEKDELEYTLCDCYPDGFTLELPFPVVPYGSYWYNRALTDSTDNITSVYIPSCEVRSIWRHPMGKWGMESSLVAVNNLVRMIQGYYANTNSEAQVLACFSSYMHIISSMLSSPKGALSNYVTSVRYPYSVKATAMVGDNMPDNYVRIHKDMADDLKVKEGDPVIVERYPCLGFLSVRPQRVTISDSDDLKYVIQVAGNELNSQNLDFDGDVLHLMSFRERETKELLRKAIDSPPDLIGQAIRNAKDKAQPQINTLSLDDYGVERFRGLTAEANSKNVESLVGMKLSVGILVSTCYNLFRIMERCVPVDQSDMRVYMELVLDKVANSIFAKKHTGGKSLDQETLDAITNVDYSHMLELGFNPIGANKLCEILKSEAKSIRASVKDKGLLNKIIKKKHMLWYACRTKIAGKELAGYLKSVNSDLISTHIIRSIARKDNKEQHVIS